MRTKLGAEAIEILRAIGYPTSWDSFTDMHGYAFLCNQPEESVDGLYAVSAESITRHLGKLLHMEEPEIKEFYVHHPAQEKNEIRAQIERCRQQVIRPIREKLKQEGIFYWYSVPTSVEVVTKKRRIDGEEYDVLEGHGPFTLRLLITSVKYGIRHGMGREELREIAEIVVYVLLKKKKATRTVRGRKHIDKLLDGWKPYIKSTKLYNHLVAEMNEHLTQIGPTTPLLLPWNKEES